jgi:hypothetical protein
MMLMLTCVLKLQLLFDGIINNLFGLDNAHGVGFSFSL